MSAAERISKYLDDSKLLISSGNIPKLLAEIKKLTSYLQKHQTETVPEGAKTKLFGTIDAYYRLACIPAAQENLVDCVTALIGSYLQLPEGKLVSATHKKKALTWFQELNVAPSDAPNDTAQSPTITTWSLEGINDDGSITLLNVANSEDWKEDYVPSNLQDHIGALQKLQAEEEAVLVDISNSTDSILAVRAASLI